MNISDSAINIHVKYYACVFYTTTRVFCKYNTVKWIWIMQLCQILRILHTPLICLNLPFIYLDFFSIIYIILKEQDSHCQAAFVSCFKPVINPCWRGKGDPIVDFRTNSFCRTKLWRVPAKRQVVV